MNCLSLAWADGLLSGAVECAGSCCIWCKVGRDGQSIVSAELKSTAVQPLHVFGPCQSLHDRPCSLSQWGAAVQGWSG